MENHQRSRLVLIYHWYLCVYRARWLKQAPDDHDLHMRNVAFRAVLEYCIVNGIIFSYLFVNVCRDMSAKREGSYSNIKHQ